MSAVDIEPLAPCERRVLRNLVERRQRRFRIAADDLHLGQPIARHVKLRRELERLSKSEIRRTIIKFEQVADAADIGFVGRHVVDREVGGIASHAFRMRNSECTLGHQHQAIGLAKQALLGQVRRGPVRDQLDVTIDVRQPGSEQEPLGTGKKLA